MTEKLRKVLDQIDKALCDSEIGEPLANILSALRGPDVAGNETVKYHTTQVIRSAAFPKLAKLARDTGNVIGGSKIWLMAKPENTFFCCDRCDPDTNAGTHFTAHVRRAAADLGLAQQWSTERY